MSAATMKKPKAKKKMRFKLLVGSHWDYLPDGGQGMYRENGEDAGNVIETTQDLCMIHNKRGKAPKFERLEQMPQGHVWNPEEETLDEFAARMRAAGAPPKEDKDDDEDEEETADEEDDDDGDAGASATDAHELEAMSVFNLRELAKERGCDLHNVTTKKDIIARLQAQAAAV